MHRTLSETRVLVADPHPLVRIGLGSMFQSVGDICLVAETGIGLEVLPLVEKTKPAVLILEVALPGQSGVVITQRLKTMNVPVRVLCFSSNNDIHVTHALCRSGVAGYLTKDEPSAVITTAVRSIAGGGEGWFSRRIATQLSNHLASQAMHDLLSKRQQEVLRLVTDGHSNRRIGRILMISEKTVEKHLSCLMVKLHAASRVEVAVQAVQKGWLQTSEKFCR